MQSVTHWTNPMAVFPWLHLVNKTQEECVAKRAGGRLDQSNVDKWQHVKNTKNAADTGTKRIKVPQLLDHY